MLVNKTGSGFGNIRMLMRDVFNQMTINHVSSLNAGVSHQFFSVAYPQSWDPTATPPGYPWNSGVYPESNVIILESNIAIDPLANIEISTANTHSIYGSWRLGFILHDDYSLTVHAGTRVTLPGDLETPAARIGSAGEITFMTNRATNPNDVEFREPPGCMNIKPWSEYGITVTFPSLPATTVPGRGAGPLYKPHPNVQIPDELFISRVSSIGAEFSYPMSYALTMNNRGIVLAVWEDNQEEIPEIAVPASGIANIGTVRSTQVYGNSPVRWFAVQRAVDRETGQVRGGYPLRGNLPYKDPITSVINEKSRCPVFCVFGTGSPNDYQKFVVRENDSLIPSPKRPASVATHDSPATFNPLQQQSVTEQGEFVVTFLNNLSTARYRYGDEMDLIGTVGAEVAGPGTSITVKVYNDVNTRTYMAMYANKQYGNGMRIMMLVQANETDEIAQSGISTAVPLPHVTPPSDIKLKSNIVKLGTTDLGIGLYEYDILDRREIGVMAQEVITVRPEAVTMGRDGFFRVNYDILGLERKVVRQY